MATAPSDMPPLPFIHRLACSPLGSFLLQNGWSDASYNSKVNWQAGRFGASGGNVVCADLYNGGALAGEQA